MRDVRREVQKRAEIDPIRILNGAHYHTMPYIQSGQLHTHFSSGSLQDMVTLRGCVCVFVNWCSKYKAVPISGWRR